MRLSLVITDIGAGSCFLSASRSVESEVLMFKPGTPVPVNRTIGAAEPSVGILEGTEELADSFPLVIPDELSCVVLL